MKTKQLEAWSGEFGREYTRRNSLTPSEMDEDLRKYYGVAKSELFRKFLGVDRLAKGRVLEVGCNIGLQLEILHTVSPGLELYGIDPQSIALAEGRQRHANVFFLPGNAFDLPFRDAYFDVVMTNGVLIHIDPSDLPLALAEIHRCSKRFIFLHEYFSERPFKVNYRGQTGLLWKSNFMQRYLDQFPDLRRVEVRYLEYSDTATDEKLMDQVCLLEKGS